MRKTSNALLLRICQRRHAHIHDCLAHMDASSRSQGPTTHASCVPYLESNVPRDRKFSPSSSRSVRRARKRCLTVSCTIIQCSAVPLRWAPTVHLHRNGTERLDTAGQSLARKNLAGTQHGHRVQKHRRRETQAWVLQSRRGNGEGYIHRKGCGAEDFFGAWPVTEVRLRD